MRTCRPRWEPVVGCLLACLVGCSTVAGPDEAGPQPIRVLQLNLCNSGIAGCHTGRAPAEAAAVIRAENPDLVTLNEVCREDVAALQRAWSDAVPGVTSAFQPARDRDTGTAYRCRSGEQYGIGVVSRWPSETGAVGGIHPTQDPDDPEERAWLCLDAAGPAVAVCTTHLAYTDRAVTLAQCRYLFGTVVAGMRARDPVTPAVVAADLNLGSADLRSCLPAGSTPVDDGGVQHVVATPGLVVDGVRTVDLRGATDHPGLLVTLRAVRPGRCG